MFCIVGYGEGSRCRVTEDRKSRARLGVSWREMRLVETDTETPREFRIVWGDRRGRRERENVEGGERAAPTSGVLSARLAIHPSCLPLHHWLALPAAAPSLIPHSPMYSLCHDRIVSET
ncbi:hypothetical protein E2C01_030191 [Portunus trituberculatus]|uniref:Uncharacterized protein n=1 Tax=Portunus trituberculatus TaxID=210409 RepID=A0A5B7EV20_PORTR|nr:hypothetical protein [Portunus trituberculatus]